ncbi:RcnB family protein [Erwinia sp. P6884]|uniref:RcnB family protein n=1 Tax=Erwinia sp. P6884 TaxID=3141450 RepID=UPI003189527E
MKKMTLALLITVITAGSAFSTLARADGPRGQQWHQQGRDRDSDRHHAAAHHNDNSHRDEHGHYQQRDRFAWQGYHFRRGQPLPAHFRERDYRVNNWHERGLHRPSRGEHWAYIDGNYVLIAAATGVITSILLNNVMQ